MISKLTDIEEINKLKMGRSLREQQWNILLDCVEAKDMCRKYYTSSPNRESTIDFLLFNPHFPRSVSSRLKMVLEYLEEIERNKPMTSNSLCFKVGKLVVPFQYMEISEIDDDLPQFLEGLLSKIYLISDLIVKEFFN